VLPDRAEHEIRQRDRTFQPLPSSRESTNVGTPRPAELSNKSRFLLYIIGQKEVLGQESVCARTTRREDDNRSADVHDTRISEKSRIFAEDPESGRVPSRPAGRCTCTSFFTL